MRILLCLFLIVQSIAVPTALAQEAATDQPFTVRKDEPQNKSGGIFFSSTKKNEVLFKANVWGAVQFPGVHYMPLGTRFLDAISYAGGPVDAANDDEILLSSKAIPQHAAVIRELSIAKAMTSLNFNPVIQPDDIIVVREDKARANVILWITVGTFILTAVALGVVISQQRN